MVYIFSFMDRTNLGIAVAGGMSESIGMTASMAGMASGIFFFGYLLLQIPAGHLAEKGSAKKFIAITIAIWGGLSVLTGFVTEVWQLMVIRFLLGVSEGGVWPAMLVMLAHWFPPEERARANAFFIMNLAIACIITGPLSGWIIEQWGWRSVFFVEGVLSIALIFVWWPLIADRPENAKWISPAERDYITRKIQEEHAAVKSEHGPVSYKSILKDVTLWKLSYIYFGYQVGIYGFIMWLPTILKTLTKGGIAQVGYLSALPYIIALPGLYLFGAWSDKSGDRKPYVALPALGGAICLILSVVFKDQIWISFGWLCAYGFFWQAYQGPFWTLPPMFFPPEVAGGARGIINALGNMGGFVGPFAVGWIVTTWGSMDIGVYVLAFFYITATLLTYTLPTQKKRLIDHNKGQAVK
nr:MFS transporter [Sporomusa sphaeroides]